LLTANAFERLLARIDPDRDRAGAEYELVRRKLVKFFECRGSLTPEDDADETISRVATRLEHEAIQNLNAYFYGVARFVLLEGGRERARRRDSVEVDRIDVPAARPPADDERLAWLEQCLDALPPASRQLLLAYYQDEKADKIRHRRRLAESFGIPINALRIRLHRLRLTVEECVKRHQIAAQP
jgi:RNA polymerase sigma factor (sigma-70 family)